MLYSSIGYYALILGLSISFFIFFFSIKNFRNKDILDHKIISFSFLQLFLVLVSFLGLLLSFVYRIRTEESGIDALAEYI